MFHGNPQRTGSSGGDIDTTNANLRWTFTVQGSAPSNVPSSPVVGKDGTVYVGSMGWPGRLYAIVASTGGLYWQSDTTAYGSISTAPAISPDGTRVYVCTVESNGINPNVLAYDAATGAKLWTGMPNDGLILPDNDFVSSSNPVAVNMSGTTVIFVCGSVEYGGGGGFPGRYRLYRIKDEGTTATCTYYEVGPLPEVPGYGEFSPSPAIADDWTVYVTTSYDLSVPINGALYAIKGEFPLTNTIADRKWPLPVAIATTPVESPGLPCVREDGGPEIIYVGCTDSRMCKLKENPTQTSADMICYQTLSSWPVTCPAIANLDADAAGNMEVVFTALSVGGTYVYALTDMGANLIPFPLWATNPVLLPNIILGSPALGWLPVAPPYQCHVFLGGGYPTGGTIYTLNGWDGAISGTFVTEGTMVSSPPVSWGYPWLLGGPGWVFATSNDGSVDGKLYAFGFVP
jgi:hypothetical protein